MTLKDFAFSISLDNYALFKEGGEKKDGTLSGYNDLSIEMDSRSSPLYISPKNDDIVLGSKIGIRSEGSREERIIFFQEVNKEQFLSDIIQGLINFYKGIGEAVNIAYQSNYKPVSIANETIDYQTLIEYLENNQLNNENLKNKPNRELSALFGKILSIDPESEDKTIISSGTLIESINFLEIANKEFPHLLSSYSVVVAQDIFNKPINILITKNSANSDYDFQSNQLNFSEIEKIVFIQFFDTYSSLSKNSIVSSSTEIKQNIMNFFPLNKINIIQHWKNINNNPKLKVLINTIIYQQYQSLISLFLFRFSSLNKDTKYRVLQYFTENPIYGKDFYTTFRNYIIKERKDQEVEEYYENIFKDYYYQQGFNAAESGIHRGSLLKNVGIVLLIGLVIFLLLLLFMPGYLKSLIHFIPIS